MTSIAVIGALLHPQLRSAQVASHQKVGACDAHYTHDRDQ